MIYENLYVLNFYHSHQMQVKIKKEKKGNFKFLLFGPQNKLKKKGKK